MLSWESLGRGALSGVIANLASVHHFPPLIKEFTVHSVQLQGPCAGTCVKVPFTGSSTGDCSSVPCKVHVLTQASYPNTREEEAGGLEVTLD